MHTKYEIRYQASPYGYIATIPEGTSVTPATNLPDGGWWVEAWDAMPDTVWGWLEGYGFLLQDNEVTTK